MCAKKGPFAWVTFESKHDPNLARLRVHETASERMFRNALNPTRAVELKLINFGGLRFSNRLLRLPPLLSSVGALQSEQYHLLLGQQHIYPWV